MSAESLAQPYKVNVFSCKIARRTLENDYIRSMNKIQYERYNPALTLAENASILGCSVTALKKHLKKGSADTRYDVHYQRWKRINDFRKEHPDYSFNRKSKELGYSINTIRRYEAMSEETLDMSYRDTQKVSRFDIKNKNAIKTVSASQDEILNWIIQLYNEGKTFDADLTASQLVFYRKSVPVPAYLYDKYPQRAEVKDLKETDVLPDGSFSSIVYDLPFILADSHASVIKERFTNFFSAEEMYSANDEMLQRSYRLLKANGLLVVKTMDTSYRGKQYWVSDYVLQNAQFMGLKLLEKFILTSNLRLFSKTRVQHIARKYHAYFFVFKKV